MIKKCVGIFKKVSIFQIYMKFLQSRKNHMVVVLASQKSYGAHIHCSIRRVHVIMRVYVCVCVCVCVCECGLFGVENCRWRRSTGKIHRKCSSSGLLVGRERKGGPSTRWYLNQLGTTECLSLYTAAALLQAVPYVLSMSMHPA